MSHPMRRSDRAISSQHAMEIISTCEYLTLATVNADGLPYAVTLSYALLNGAIYFHSAKEGQKCENIALNPNVCFTVVGKANTLSESFSVDYESVVAVGKCTLVSDPKESLDALMALVDKYSFDNPNKVAYASNCKAANVYRIDITQFTGKAND